MSWLTDRLFGTKTQPEKTDNQPQETLKAQPPKLDPKVRYLRDTLKFAQQQHKELSNKHVELDRWHRRYGSLEIVELKKLSGIEFEDYLANLFIAQGYTIQKTPISGDYGADLLIKKDQRLIAVQAKCYSGSVGVSAVQEALSGMAYYSCHSAWVVTTGNYTNNAVELATKSNVRLIDSHELGKLVLQMQGKLKNA